MAAPDPETQPLLRQRSRSDTSIPHEPPPTKKRLLSWPTFTTISPKYRFIPFLGCLLILLNESEYFIKQVAMLRAIESMHCYEHYLALNSPLTSLGKSIPERLCKAPSIQKSLAHTAGLIMFFRMLSAMLGAVPLGWLADRYGRKPVLIMHKLNVTVSCAVWLALYLLFPRVPIWTLYLSGVSGLIGGNFDIGLAMLFAAYTDVMPSAGERATLFFLTTSMQYLAQTVGPGLGAVLMDLDGKGGTPEVNLTVSLVIACSTAVITILFFPETVHESRKDKSGSGAASLTPVPSSRPQTRSWLSLHYHRLTAQFEAMPLLNLALLALSILLAATGIKSIDWFALIQYPVLKLHWTLPQASSIVSAQGFLMLLHFSLLLPWLTRRAAGYWDDELMGQFVVMLASAGLLVVGSVAIGLSASVGTFVAGVVVYLLGEGLPTATQAFIVAILPKDRVARSMAVLSMASIGGKLGASLGFPWVLAKGLDSGVEVLVGLPFFVSAGMFVVAAVGIVVVGWRVRRERGRGVEV